MATVTLPTINPPGQIVVNAQAIFAAVEHPAPPSNCSELLPDSAGGVSIFITADVEHVGSLLGSDFAEFAAASISGNKCYINRTGWVRLIPHPQIPNVVQIWGHSRYVAVHGTLQQVQTALSS